MIELVELTDSSASIESSWLIGLDRLFMFELNLIDLVNLVDSFNPSSSTHGSAGRGFLLSPSKIRQGL